MRPYLWIFALTLVFSMGNTVLGSLTPQVVRVAVDSILGGEPFPKVVTALAPGALLAAAPMTQLLAAAEGIMPLPEEYREKEFMAGMTEVERGGRMRGRR